MPTSPRIAPDRFVFLGHVALEKDGSIPNPQIAIYSCRQCGALVDFHGLSKHDKRCWSDRPDEPSRPLVDVGIEELEKMRENGGAVPWYADVPWFGRSILAAYDAALGE